MNQLIYKYFNDDDFLRISQQIKESEKTTSGEIRISFREKRGFFQKWKSLKDLAAQEFHRIGMSNTRDKTGILLYLLLNEKQFYILADEGINSKVDQATWDEVRDEIQKNFRAGKYLDGIISGIQKVGNILTMHFPIKPDDTNELSNEIVIN